MKGAWGVHKWERCQGTEDKWGGIGGTQQKKWVSGGTQQVEGCVGDQLPSMWRKQFSIQRIFYVSLKSSSPERRA